ncbi:AEC family transporter [Oceanospirillaceae bacterium]|nr:AEC family transporter [Oceanospirillaceae bacterium]
MNTILPVISSILLVMLLGYGLSKRLLTEPVFWQGISKLSYWVLFPVLIIRTLANATINTELLVPLLVIFSVSLVLVLIYCFWASRLLGQDGPSAASLVQGGIRHNGFIGLAVLFDMFGLPGQEVGALIIAVLLPPTNFLSVLSVSVLVRKKQAHSLSALITKELVRNPMLIAVSIGLLINVLDFPVPHILDQSMAFLSRAALPMLLLSIGASLSIRALKGNWLVLMVALSAKLLVFPALFLAGALWFNLTPLVTVCLVVFGALPTAVSAYPFIHQMGGNAKLMADIITLQTLASLIGLTFWASLAIHITGLAL